MTRTQFVFAQAAVVAVMSTVLGLATGNPNWLQNIPLGLLAGGVAGWLMWPVLMWLVRKSRSW